MDSFSAQGVWGQDSELCTGEQRSQSLCQIHHCRGSLADETPR